MRIFLCDLFEYVGMRLLKLALAACHIPGFLGFFVPLLGRAIQDFFMLGDADA